MSVRTCSVSTLVMPNKIHARSTCDAAAGPAQRSGRALPDFRPIYAGCMPTNGDVLTKPARRLRCVEDTTTKPGLDLTAKPFVFDTP